jgi:hypothetical protein
MAENEITSETEAKQEETEYLTDCLKELQCLFNLVQTWEFLHPLACRRCRRPPNQRRTKISSRESGTDSSGPENR